MCLAGLDHVLYCDIESNIRDADMSAESLQRLPVSISLKPARNGIAYLTRNIEIECYHSAYLSDLDAVLTGCSDWTRQRHKQKAANRLTITDRIAINRQVMRRLKSDRRVSQDENR
jgi:hypothetical protein